jgi:(p)ppGpp synthase/HD superfamily hydrolase
MTDHRKAGASLAPRELRISAKSINSRLQERTSHRRERQAPLSYVQPAPATLERAIEIAARAHAGQFAPDGTPYILHPLRMLVGMRSLENCVVAILHDVVEKSDGWSIEKLRREGFSSDIVEAVDSLTRRPEETFAASIKRAKANRIARQVKRADITDHLRHFPPESNRSDYPDALLDLLTP